MLDGEAASTVVAAAARLAISLGLHRRLTDVSLPMSEILQRRKVFWALYILENA
jgi:hypothetical protein